MRRGPPDHVAAALRTAAGCQQQNEVAWQPVGTADRDPCALLRNIQHFAIAHGLARCRCQLCRNVDVDAAKCTPFSIWVHGRLSVEDDGPRMCSKCTIGSRPFWLRIEFRNACGCLTNRYRREE